MNNDKKDVTIDNKEIIKVTASGWLGTAMEFMDFQLYSLAAAIVFNEIFFNNEDPSMALIMAMGTYGAGYCARLLGAWFFGRLGDKIGRRDVLFFTIALMGIASTGIGFLPTYAQVGIWAPLGLVILRIIQGFGAGAEISGAGIMTVEFAKRKNRGFVGSFVCLGTSTGTLIANGIWTIILTQCNHTQLLSWGWRIPFFASFIVMIAAILIRLFIKESPVMAQKKKELARLREDMAKSEGVGIGGKELNEKVAYKKISQKNRRASVKNFVLAGGLRFGQAGNSGLMQTYLAAFLVTYLSVARTVPTNANMIASIISFFTIPLVGWLGDKFGRRTMYLVLSGAMALFAIPMMLMISTKNTTLITIAIIVGLNIGVQGLFSLENIMIPELFGSLHRMTFSSLAKEIAGLFATGFGPVIAASLVSMALGSWWPLALMMIFFSACTFLSAWLAPNTNDRDLNDLYDPVITKHGKKRHFNEIEEANS
ncbi:MFS transporter [Lactobacillus helsingborgensis]|uniref:MFS transporter n=1 Tax=Lactobacillus helsingborgensis TaxID=1218494 RepID=UPI001CC5559D|nr:MFS transporter [Lactobacillus helsingborgensis]